MKIVFSAEGIGSFLWELPPELAAKVEERIAGVSELLQDIGERKPDVGRAFVDGVNRDSGRFLLAITAVYSADRLRIIPAYFQLQKNLDTLVNDVGKACEC